MRGTIGKHQGRNPRTNAFTLAEVLIALLISVVMVIAIITLLSFNFTYQNQQELRANAMDAMGREMERLKKQFIFTVDPYSVLVTDNRTPDNPNDDTTATLAVELFDRNGTKLTAAPTGFDRVTVVMTVAWRGRGRLSHNTYTQSLVGYLIP